jgi:hypothetical protein
VLIITKKKIIPEILEGRRVVDTLQIPNAFSNKLFGVFAGRRGSPCILKS